MTHSTEHDTLNWERNANSLFPAVHTLTKYTIYKIVRITYLIFPTAQNRRNHTPTRVERGKCANCQQLSGKRKPREDSWNVHERVTPAAKLLNYYYPGKGD